MRTPVVKFVHHTCSYVIFLFYIIMAATISNPFVSMGCEGFSAQPLTYLLFMFIFVWIVGMLEHECVQLWRDGLSDYLSDWCNWIDSLMVALFLCYFSLNFNILFTISYGVTDEQEDYLCSMSNPWPDSSCQVMECQINAALHNMSATCSDQPDCAAIEATIYTPDSKEPALDTMSRMQQLADMCLGYGCVFAFVRVAHLLPANESLGPLLVTVGRMLRDILRFSILFSLVQFGFTCALTCIYSGHDCENDHFTDVPKSFDTLFWSMFGMGNPKAYVLDERHLATGQVTSHTAHSTLLPLAGYVLYSAYMAMMVIISMNMLIAMMSNSFQEIHNDRDVEWKFARAKLWINYFDRGFTLPVPFNLLPSLKQLAGLVKSIGASCKKKPPPSPPPQNIDTSPAVVNQLKSALQNLQNEIAQGTDQLKPPNLHKRRNSTALTINDFFGMLNFAEPEQESAYKKVVQRLVQRYIYKKHLEHISGRRIECELKALQMRLAQKASMLDEHMDEQKMADSHVTECPLSCAQPQISVTEDTSEFKYDVADFAADDVDTYTNKCYQDDDVVEQKSIGTERDLSHM